MSLFTTPPYSRYAEIYDQTGQSRFGLRMLTYIRKILQTHQWQGGRVLDLACGTGAVALRLAREGYEVLGVDCSEAMLRQARGKSAGVKNAPVWLQQDMRALALNRQVDLVTCFYDSLNYILSLAEMKQVFLGVREALVPGGLFLFDLNTLFALAHHWDGLADARDEGDVAYIWRCWYDPRTRISDLEATFFVRRGELYEKFVEVHRECGYEQEEIIDALLEVGLEFLEAYAYPTYDPPHEETTRIVYVARRPLPGAPGPNRA